MNYQEQCEKWQAEADEARETELQSKWPGMTYEQGVINALEWVLGQRKESPMNDE